MWMLLLAACGPDLTAVYDPSRSEHFFDVPFPSNDVHLGPDGRADLTGWPLPTPPLSQRVAQGWVERTQLTTVGFANHGAAYFRFDGALDLPQQTGGSPDDPVLLVAIDGSELLPLEVRFVADPHGDPHWGPNTLALAPQLGHPPKSGGTYAAVVMQSAGAKAPDNWEVPEAVDAALDAAGVRGKVAMATVFTVQDATAQMRALFADADTRDLPDGVGAFRRVVKLEFKSGETPSGKPSHVCTATFANDSTSIAYLAEAAPEDDKVLDLLDWPMAVYEGQIPILNYQDEDDRPYMRAGALHLNDVDRMTGWIDFDVDGTLLSEPWVEWMRVIVSIPKGPDGEPIDNAPVLLWDHGTGGHAWEIVARSRVPAEDARALNQVFADAGFATVGHDATLYGQRYPLIDEGYGSQLGFYNIVNLPAFRDNQRQTAVDAHVLRRFLAERMNDALPEGSINPEIIRHGGHSLGSVTSNLSFAAAPQQWGRGFLSGTGGLFTHYFLDTGLLTTFDEATLETLFALFGQEPPEEVDTVSIAGTVLGLEPAAWEHIDRLHPFFTLFQWQMDPSDPMAVARDETLPISMTIAQGDLQTPAFTAEALSRALPDAKVYPCEASGDYDPHQCMWREPEGRAAMAEWLAEE
jgi:hypothetical protein